MLEKRASEISGDDIRALITDATPEDDQIEFKETLPAKDGKRDAWLDGASSIGDYARNNLLAEIVAFANAHGGAVILGIRESEDKPSRAVAINPIPRCAELAERLRLQCRDTIEPQIPLLETAGIVTEPDGTSGVVVIRAPQSRMAPHRLRPTRACYVRRADRTEEMTMREIQDLTLQVERGLSGLEARFRERAAAFNQQISENSKHTLGFRATMLPLSPLFLDRVHRVEGVRPSLERFKIKIDGKSAEIFVPGSFEEWRATLRGSRSRLKDERRDYMAQVFSDGLIEFWLFYIEGEPNDHWSLHLYPAWWMGLVANSFWAAERFREAAGAPATEYGLELEIVNRKPGMSVQRYGTGGFSDSIAECPTGTIHFPRYSVGPPEEFNTLAALIERDFWNAMGRDFDRKIEIEPDA